MILNYKFLGEKLMLKKQFSRFLVLCTVFAMSILGPLSSIAFAEGEAFNAKKFPMSNFYLEIAPEYDQPAEWPKDEPSMILFQKATITNMSGSNYAGPIEVPVPAKEKGFQVLSVGEFDPKAQNNADSTPVEYKLDSEKGVIVFTPSKPIADKGSYTYGVSVIYNPFKIDGAKKSLEVAYTSPANVVEFDVAIYTPINAKNPQVDPKPDKQEEKNKEQVFTYHFHDVVKAGDVKTFKVQYEKADNKTSNQWIQENGAPESNTSTSKTPTSALDTNVALIIGGAILIFGLILFFAIKGKKGSQATTRQQKRNEARKNQTDNKSYQSAAVKKKVLRKLLIDGEITEEEFAEEMKNL
ncbi:MAG: hypothetical protein K0R71_1982 [Bacillales bacterium]|jgi:hypothetical protein|nr:hypothetical protein [Bacillales bacterium]